MIKLDSIMHIDNCNEYKIHVAKYNRHSNPLDDFIEDINIWYDWNRWRSKKVNRFTRKYVISFLDFYPQRGTFLFGGIFKILKTYEDSYDIELLDNYKEFIGRLKVKNINTPRGSAFNFERYYNDIEIVELLDKSYENHVFPGYENIDFTFKQIKKIINQQPLDWKSALSNVKGIYMLTNTDTGKRYIGSAYGDIGIWSRWTEYCFNGHGNNKDLIRLSEQRGYEYIENNFKFTLLEIHPMFTSDNDIIIRENFWKNVMMSKSKKFGYNSN